MIVAKSIVSGKHLLGLALMLTLVTVAMWQLRTQTWTAQSDSGFQGVIFTVTPAVGQTFSINSIPSGAAFSVDGDIACVNERGQPLGTGCTGKFYRTGIKLASGAAVVQDVYVVQQLNGAIMAEGVLNPELTGGIEQANLTAIVGGVGTFRGAIGELQITNNVNGVGTNNATGTFTARSLQPQGVHL